MITAKREMWFYAAVFAIVTVQIHPSYAGEQQRRNIRVLFIGNSHSMRITDPLVELVNTTSTTTKIEVDLALKGDARLSWHWNDTEVNDVVNRIKNNRYDYVVIQESGASTGYPDFRAEMDEYVPKFTQLVKSSGAQPILFCTHEYYNNAYGTSQETITEAYWKFALENDAEFLPIGPICKKIRDDHELILHIVHDPIHANQLGRAIYVYTLYCHLTGEPVLGRHTPAAAEYFLPKRPEDVPPPGERFTVRRNEMRKVKQELTPEKLAVLQKTVFEEVIRWKRKQFTAKQQSAKLKTAR